MHVRITESGWAGFTGLFGHVQFTDGVSDDISRADAAQLAALVQIEDAATGVNPSAAQSLLDAAHNKAPVVAVVLQSESPVVDMPVYTHDQLVAAADKGGIKALRELVEPTGVSGKSIAEIVGKVMQGQTDRLAREAAAAAAVAAADAAASAVTEVAPAE